MQQIKTTTLCFLALTAPLYAGFSKQQLTLPQAHQASRILAAGVVALTAGAAAYTYKDSLSGLFSKLYCSQQQTFQLYNSHLNRVIRLVIEQDCNTARFESVDEYNQQITDLAVPIATRWDINRSCALVIRQAGWLSPLKLELVDRANTVIKQLIISRSTDAATIESFIAKLGKLRRED